MKKFEWLMLGLVLCGILLSGCSKNSDIVSGTGAIVFNDFEGGFYGIEADDGGHYDPRNLPAEYEEDGLRVWFKVKLTDYGSTHMWGIVVEIIEIRKL